MKLRWNKDVLLSLEWQLRYWFRRHFSGLLTVVARYFLSFLTQVSHHLVLDVYAAGHVIVVSIFVGQLPNTLPKIIFLKLSNWKTLRNWDSQRQSRVLVWILRFLGCCIQSLMLKD